MRVVALKNNEEKLSATTSSGRRQAIPMRFAVLTFTHHTPFTHPSPTHHVLPNAVGNRTQQADGQQYCHDLEGSNSYKLYRKR